jgi:predicted nucleic acid-binding protein
LILDTNAVSALLQGDNILVELLSDVAHHHLPTVVVGEYRYGLKRSRHRELLTSMFEGLIGESTILPIDLATASHYATLRNELRDQGTPIPENDLWIAALSRQHALMIVSRDRHFDHVAGVLRKGW